MKKIAVALLCLSVFGLDSFAQSGRTRPRVVITENNPNPTVSVPTNTTQNPTSPSTTSAPTTSGRRPPVLTGNTIPTTPKPAPSSSPSVNSDDLGVVEDDEVIKVETNLVTLPVAVLDRNGRFISGLQQSDFQIYEDGVAQKVEYFASLENPFTVVLLIDVSNSTAFKIEEIQDAAIAFINQLRPEDRVTVISFDEKVHVLSPATNNRVQLQNAIRRLNFGGGTSLYEAVDQAIKTEISRIEGRKAIVLFTDGVDTTSKRSSYQTNIRDAEEMDAMVYPIRFDTYDDMNGGYGGGGNGGGYPMPPRRRRGGGGWGGILSDILSGGGNNGGSIRIGNGGGSNGDYAEGKRYLEDLARVSGGRNFEARNTYNLEAAFSGIAEELRRQYSIGYYPENAGQPGQRKQVSVRVKQTNAVVRAKNSYIVGNNGTVAQQKSKTAPTVKTTGRLPF
jgi:Ca-activated chloride channel homolog